MREELKMYISNHILITNHITIDHQAYTFWSLTSQYIELENASLTYKDELEILSIIHIFKVSENIFRDKQLIFK